MNEAINAGLAGVNRIGEVFCHYAVGAFIQSALLVLVLFGLDLLLRNRVRAVFRYCVWLLVLVKLVLPPTLSLPTGIGYWLGDRLPATTPVAQDMSWPVPERGVERPPSAAAQVSDAIVPVLPAATVVEPAAPVPPPTMDRTPITWQAIVFLCWLAGVLTFVALLGQRVRFVRGLVAASTPAGGELVDRLEQCRRQMRVHRPVGLRTLDALPSPAVCGLWQPTILMPTPLVERLSPEGLRAALIHELAHIKRADLWVNAVQTVLQVVYFYNPFVWLANARIRRTCEEAVDETVLVTLRGQAKSYSNTLIDISEMMSWKADLGLRLIGVAESRKALQGRIKHMLTRPIPKSARVGAVGTITILVVAAVLLPMARAERSSKHTSATGPVPGVEATEKAPGAGESDTVIDPNTGLKVVLAQTIGGANNVIEHLNKLTLSPDGRFLLWWGRVVPLDGTEAFGSGYQEEVAVSPNGRYVAHGGSDAVWVQPVSPETLRPSGPPKKLLDLKGEYLPGAWGRPEALHWTRDSETVFFRTQATGGKHNPYAFSAATGARVSFPDAVARGLLSPDGKCVVFTDGNPGFWVQTIGEDTARNLCGEGPAPLCWSGDGRWLIAVGRGGGVMRFTQYPDGKEYLVSLPSELESSSACVGASPDKKRLYFYQPGYELKNRIKVASAANAPLVDVDAKAPWTFTWAPDSKAILNTLYRGSRQGGLMACPLSGEEAIPFAINPTISGIVAPFSVSPDGKWLLFARPLQPDTGMFDLAVAPLSMTDHEVKGPATVIFHQAPRAAGAHAWSPDSTRVALVSRADPGDNKGIWIASTDGRAPFRLTGTTGSERDLQWSPDGSTLAFASGTADTVELKIVSSSGGEPTVLRTWADANEAPSTWGWSPDSKSLTIPEKDMLIRQPLSGGAAESIANLKESGLEQPWWLSWSPDGKRLALECDKPGNKDLRVWGQLLFARVEEGRLQQTAAVDLKGGTWNYVWSPDSESVAYTCEDAVVVRPVGRLYALALDDVLDKINAGAIAPTQKPTAPLAVPKQATEAGPLPQPEPILGSVFSDNFDAGPSKYWQIVDSNTEKLPPPGHATENGQLMLSNSSFRLDQIDWTDYVVKVRVCMKEAIPSGEAVFGIQARTTPCPGGFQNRDRYNFVIVCLDGRPMGLYLGINYRDPSNTAHNANLDRSSYIISLDKWYTLELEVRGRQLRGYLDGKLMVEATDERLSKGGIWLGAWRSRALFDDFSVRLLP